MLLLLLYYNVGKHLEHAVYTLVSNFSPTFVCILTQHAVCLQQRCSNPPTKPRRERNFHAN